MDGHLVVGEDYVSQRKYLCRPNLLCPCSYNFVFCVPVEDYGKNVVPGEIRDQRKYTKWFTISIHADGPGELYTREKPLTSFWDGKLYDVRGFAALGSHVYDFSGPTFPNSLDVTHHGGCSLDPVCPMICPRSRLRNLVIDGKIYVFSGHREHYLSKEDIPPYAGWGEVFDPENGQWEALPDPPYVSSFTIMYAALENPNRILVGFHVPDTHYCAMLYTYNVQNRSWKILSPEPKLLPSKYSVMSRQRTVTVHNTLYWVSRIYEKIFLIAYDLDLDMWFEESLMGLGLFGHTSPFLFHLEEQRFCLSQTSTSDDYDDDDDDDNDYEDLPSDADLHCVAFDISHMPGEKRLGISLAWEQKYKVDCSYVITDCLLLPEIEQEELLEAN